MQSLEPAAPLDAELVTARGVLDLNGRSIPLALSGWMRGPAGFVERAVDDAGYLERSPS